MNFFDLHDDRHHDPQTFEEWLDCLIDEPERASEVPWESAPTEGFEAELLVGKWLELIAAHPQFAQRFDWRQARHCTDSKLWAKLLSGHIEYEKYCPWERFSPMEWWMFFKYLPRYFEKCSFPEKVPARAWAYLLCHRPELADRFDRWQEFTPAVWAGLLHFQPELSSRCPCLQEVRALDYDDLYLEDDALHFPGETSFDGSDFLADCDYDIAHLEEVSREAEAAAEQFEKRLNQLDELEQSPRKDAEDVPPTPVEETAALPTPQPTAWVPGVVNQETMRVPEGYPNAREILTKHYPSIKDALQIKGGWGYSQEDAVVVFDDQQDPSSSMFSFDGIDIENIFIDCRLHEEAEHAHETKYDGLRWKKVGQSLHCDDEFSYDCITVEVEMFTPGDWDFLQADWEAHDGYKDDSAGAAQHQRLREARAIRFTSVFWFNISNFFF